jgi:protein disulfide-isomerase
MKKFFGLVIPLVVTVSGFAEVLLGDTYEKVVREKGTPSGKIEAGASQILRYSDQTIKLKDGRVISVDNIGGRAPVPTPPRPSAAPAVKPPSSNARSAVPGKVTWMTDYAAALAQAKEQDRKVFLFFTGSDWCGWCMRLNKEILSTPEFARYAQEKLVLVELDFPQKIRQSSALKNQNAALARQYRIQGYPSVIVLGSSGKPVGELGYQEGGPEPFQQALTRM